MSTTLAKPAEMADRKWYVIDAAGKPLGRVAAKAAVILRGKNKTTFTPNVDCGDHVIIINCDEAVLTGKKLEKKFHRTHSGWIGGLKETQYKTLMAENSDKAMTYAANKHNKVDDTPYGGGAGMVMQAAPVYGAYEAVKEQIGYRPRVIYLTPQGSTFSQPMAEEFAKEQDLVFLCGHYEGIDERVLEEIVTDYVSIGDYVLTGGELPAMVMMDAISRLVPGVLHNEASAEFESFQGNLLEHPHYSRPEVWHEKRVPEVLLSGHHANIEKWRREQSVIRTAERRPDLLEKADLSAKEKALADRCLAEKKLAFTQEV